MAKKDGEEKDPRGNAVVKSERAVNSILGGLERLGRKGKALTATQKTQIFKAIDDGVSHTKLVLAGKAESKGGFALAAE